MCKLRKAGLKQSPRAWFERFSGAMVEIGFRRCHADYSVFIKRRAEGTTLLLVYVEDIVLTGDDGKSIKFVLVHTTYSQEHKQLMSGFCSLAFCLLIFSCFSLLPLMK